MLAISVGSVIAAELIAYSLIHVPKPADCFEALGEVDRRTRMDSVYWKASESPW